MNKRNYQKELEKIIESNQKNNLKPSLLLHACCAPCSSYVIEYLAKHFTITIYFYNPNIYPEKEYAYRSEELYRLVKEMNLQDEINIIIETYNPNEFFDIAKGLESAPEGGDRCFKCYELRLRKTALNAKLHNLDYFTTTLSISPLKNAEKLNAIGKKLSDECDVAYLFSDFKKKNGYKRSIELSKEYNLYRQDFCGCVYSKNLSKEEDVKADIVAT